MKKLIIIALACYGLCARAQQPAGSYLYLYSDSIISADRIRLRADLWGGLAFRYDNQRISATQVKFFYNDHGFFANTRKMNPGNVSSFSERVITGRINLYQQQPYVFDAGMVPYGPPPVMPVQQTVDRRMFYNKGFGDLKRVNYADLAADLADVPESLQLLERYRRKRQTAGMLYGAAGAAIFGGVASVFVQQANLKPGNPGRGGFMAAVALIGIGGGLSVGGYLTGAKAQYDLEAAIDRYNK